MENQLNSLSTFSHSQFFSLGIRAHNAYRRNIFQFELPVTLKTPSGWY